MILVIVTYALCTSCSSVALELSGKGSAFFASNNAEHYIVSRSLTKILNVIFNCLVGSCERNTVEILLELSGVSHFYLVYLVSLICLLAGSWAVMIL
jgi:hypothetical protein